MNTGRYILVDKKPVEEPDLIKWATWFHKADRHVGNDRIGEIRVSTVFLGISHDVIGGGYPILYETMIFGARRYSDYQIRYSTWEEAEQGHKEAVRMVKRGPVLYWIKNLISRLWRN